MPILLLERKALNLVFMNGFRTLSFLSVTVLICLFIIPFTAAENNFTGMSLSDTCKSKRNKTFSLYFNLDTAKTDFYSLLQFIESKGEFSRFDSDNKEDSSTATSIILKKILCWEKLSKSPVEYWKLQNVFSISYFLQSTTPVEINKEPTSFRLTQLNFTDNSQMEIAAEKIAEIRWGEPLLAWSFWFLIKGNNRIYIIENYIPGHIAVTQKYRDIIRDEWVK